MLTVFFSHRLNPLWSVYVIRSFVIGLELAWLDFTWLWLFFPFCFFFWKSHRNILRKCLRCIVLVCVCVVLFYASANENSYACMRCWLLVHFSIAFLSHNSLERSAIRSFPPLNFMVSTWTCFLFCIFYFIRPTNKAIIIRLVRVFHFGLRKKEKLEIFFQKKKKRKSYVIEKKNSIFFSFFFKSLVSLGNIFVFISLIRIFCLLL